MAGAADVLAALPTDTDARAVWADAVAALADGLLITQAVLAPELVVLGGGLGAAGGFGAAGAGPAGVGPAGAASTTSRLSTANPGRAAAMACPALVGQGPGDTPLVFEAGRLYLRRYWDHERTVRDALSRRLAQPPRLTPER